MRVIKFRAWNGDTQTMIHDIVGSHRLVLHLDEDELTLMQYTGVRSKNGKGIYESDILRINDGRTATVVWVERYLAYYIEWLPDRHGVALSLWTHKELEVIGNIYENPELLKENNP